jgi:hypothetical protein
MARPKPEAKNLLLVEGPDDQHTLWALLQSHEARFRSGLFEVMQKGGIDPLLEDFSIRLKSSSSERLGLVIDADQDLSARWESIRNRLLLDSPQISIPNVPPAEGLVCSLANRMRFGAWLMPNNQTKGMIEDFIKLLVPSGDSLWPRVEAFLDEIPKNERKFRDIHRPKAALHSWLALQEEPGRPYGQAITAKLLDAHSPQAKPFLDWLAKLFL